MKYIKMMCVVALLGIYMGACSKEQKKETPVTVQEESNRVVDQTKEAPLEKKVETEVPVEQGGEQVPPTEESVKTPEVKVDAEQKQGKFLVVIDPGHQEKANLNLEPVGPGAVEQKYKVTDGTTGVVTKKRESVLMLEAAVMLKEKLEAKGIQVLMTRTSHDVDISNKERATFANDHQADLFLRLHADGSENQAQKGFAVLTPAEGNTYTKGIYAESLQVSQIIIERMKENSQVKVNGIKFRDDLSGFNWSKVPSVLLELGFMSNPEEDKKLSDPQYVSSLLQSVTEGVETYRKSKA
ncbi:N-acetylmuramoyl-L-alanine amidase [Bacillus cereus]|uniref:N-acetylmuramoyl-L-alanine amidase n=1 Tax=Bacillus cereus TaxID=1396 RepID=A0A2B0LPA1_BACCE|nr:N-acetylmuramoyl-L-alanine amidase [Bacillus cereus]